MQTFFLPFAAAFIFWGLLYLLYYVVLDYIQWKYNDVKHRKYANNHFKETERFYRGFDQ